MSFSDNISAVIAAIGTAIKGKQDKLESGTNIKTINNIDIVGSGNINIASGSSEQNVFIQENEPDISSGSALWIEKKENGNISIWLKEV